MGDQLKNDKWMVFWELYDKACWNDYLNRKDFMEAYKESPDNLRRLIHDKILVPAIEEIEENLEKVDKISKFLYWFRFQRELLIASEDYNWIAISDIEKQSNEEYNEYINWISNGINPKPKPNKEYFKWFYIAICSLSEEAKIFLDEILFDLPVFNKSAILKKDQSAKKKEQNMHVINIFNHGNINSIINSVSNHIPDFRLDADNKEVVKLILDNFKNQIENNGLWKLLYEGPNKELRHENSAQLLFFSVAQIFCMANDIDVSPETNSGNGSVDFKFSKGFFKKINVELKYSKNKNLEHGFTDQLINYNKSENTDVGFYVILQVDSNVSKINKIEKLLQKDKHEQIDVIIIDCQKKKSASIKKEK